jgi:undecaprenyl-diphosphatase
MSAWLVRLQTHDERILQALVLRRGGLLDRLMSSITHLGDASSTVGLTLALAAGVFPGLRSAGVFAGIALVSSHLAVQALKRSICRSRPQLPVGYNALIEAPDRFSFPSGHAAASLSVGIGLATVWSAPAAAATLVLSALVGISRCYLGVHYPGDVLAGWILALLGAVLAGLIL